MTHIRSDLPTRFFGRYNCAEEVTYLWFPDGVNQSQLSGGYTEGYTFESVLPVLAPGKVIGGTFLKEALDDYCRLALPRASLLYRAKSATTARSNALADVTGLESNWIENLSQVKGTANVVKPLLLAWKAVETGNLQMGKRAFIDAYLNYKYVVSPAIRDFNDIKNNGRNVAQRITTNRFSQERRRGLLLEKKPVCDVVPRWLFIANYYYS